MTIPFLDLKAGYLELRDEFDAAYRRVMESGWVLLGEETTSCTRWAGSTPFSALSTRRGPLAVSCTKITITVLGARNTGT